MLAIWEWERRWAGEHAEQLPGMRHTACGRDFAPDPRLRIRAARRSSRVRSSPSGGRADAGSVRCPVAATRRRWDSDGPTRQPGLFPETMTIFGNRWASALIGAVFRGADPVRRPRGRASARRRPWSPTGCGRSPPSASWSPARSLARTRLGRVPPHREGPRLLPGRRRLAPVGPAVVPLPGGPGGRADPPRAAAGSSSPSSRATSATRCSPARPSRSCPRPPWPPVPTRNVCEERRLAAVLHTRSRGGGGGWCEAVDGSLWLL